MPKFQPNTGFKLSQQSHKSNYGRRLNIGNREEAAPGTPLFRKKLDNGIQGEANKDGTIFIDESVIPNSETERQILAHEMKHLTDMKIGKLAYDDNYIKFDGKEYPRSEGHILYNGEWLPEGSKDFPWEKH
jgi:hypothetical protein